MSEEDRKHKKDKKKKKDKNAEEENYPPEYGQSQIGVNRDSSQANFGGVNNNQVNPPLIPNELNQNNPQFGQNPPPNPQNIELEKKKKEEEEKKKKEEEEKRKKEEEKRKKEEEKKKKIPKKRETIPALFTMESNVRSKLLDKVKQGGERRPNRVVEEELGEPLTGKSPSSIRSSIESERNKHLRNTRRIKVKFPKEELQPIMEENQPINNQYQNQDQDQITPLSLNNNKPNQINTEKLQLNENYQDSTKDRLQNNNDKNKDKNKNSKDKDKDNKNADKISVSSELPPKPPLEIALTHIDEPFAQLYLAKKAYIDQFYEMSDLFVCCSMNYRYKIALEFEKKGESFVLFQTFDNSSFCGHDFCPNQARSFNIDVHSFTTESHIIQQFANLRKPCRCGFCCLCACCSRPRLIVTDSFNNKIMGNLVDKATACTPVVEVFYMDNRKPSWRIVDTCCQCCRKSSSYIYKAADVKYDKRVGEIHKTFINGEKLKPDSEHIEIVFPVDANPVEKFLFISAALFITYLYYQRIKNKTQCHN